MNVLANKVALITGASSGIGRAAAKLFAQQGARVIATGRNEAALAELHREVAQQGGDLIALPGNVRDEAHARALVEAALAHYGGLDIAFNNAGQLGAMGPTPGMALQDWQSTLDVNLTSAFLGAKYQIPAMLMRGGGSLIFTSTFVGHAVGFAGMAAYAASKAGLIGLTRALAAEFGPQGVRVNTLLPGGTDTPMGREVAHDDAARQHIGSLHALKRMASPDEIARSALYLASDWASFTTGSALMVDGGVSVVRG